MTPTSRTSAVAALAAFLTSTTALLLTGFGLLGIVLGALVAAQDAADATDDWHGLGIFIGGVAVTLGLVLSAVGGVALWLVRVQRRRAAAQVLAGLGLTLFLLVASRVAAMGSGLVVPSLLVAVVLALPLALTSWSDLRTPTGGSGPR